MKKNFKKILSVLLIVIVLVSCFTISASAATARTNTYYVYQQESYGQLSLSRIAMAGTTYCELNRAGKIVKVNYQANLDGVLFNIPVQNGGNYDTDSFTQNTNSSSNFVEVTASCSNGGYFVKAQSYHKVKVTDYIIWDSAECDGNTNGYDIPTIVL